MRLRSEPKITPGQRFRPAGMNAFGPSRREWEVVHVGRGSDGHLAAQLVAVSDPSVSKTLAIDALLDRRLYQPLVTEQMEPR